MNPFAFVSSLLFLSRKNEPSAAGILMAFFVNRRHRKRIMRNVKCTEGKGQGLILAQMRKGFEDLSKCFSICPTGTLRKLI